MSQLCPIPKCIPVNIERCKLHDECLDFSCYHLNMSYIIIWVYHVSINLHLSEIGF